MFVCPVPKISQVMIKWRRRASHLGRFTLWHNGCRATQLGRFTLWHNGRRATQLGKFTLWHNGRQTKPGLMHVPGVADIYQRQGQIMLKNVKAESKVKFWKMKALDDSAITDRCTLYEDSANFLKDARFTKTEYQTSANLWKNATCELAHQSEAKRKQAPQSEANVCRQRKCNL